MESVWVVIQETWSWLMANLFPMNLILALVIVFFQRRDPKTVWTWLLALIFLPGIGFVLYLVIGQNMHKRKMFETKAVEDKIHAVIHQQEEHIIRDEFEELDEPMKEYSDLVMYNLQSSGAVYSNDNRVQIFTDGTEKFSDLIEELKKAKSSIHIQYYIIRSDEVLSSVEEVLTEKVKEGVNVRILYDSMGCSAMKERDWDRLRSEGIQIGEFFPALLKKLQLRVNYRNHRKIVVIDNEVAYIGGFNMGREYLGKSEKFGYWRDTHLKIHGTAVLSLQNRFILDWNYATKENLFRDSRFFVRPHNGNEGDVGLQIVSSGPDSQYQNIRNNYLRIIHKAKSNLYIQTPYFIPDEVILDAICVAAMSGVDVRVMIPCKPDHPFIYWATFSYLEDLLGASVKCYTYDNGFLHAKTIMADGKISSVGSANMDIRSFKLNFEVNAVIYNENVTQALEDGFIQDLRHCTQITSYSYGKRGLWIRFKEQVSRLLSPLM